MSSRIAVHADGGAAALVRELEGRGHDVRTIATPAGLLALVTEWAPDVVVLMQSPAGIAGRVRELSDIAQLVLVTPAPADADSAEALDLHAVLGVDVTVATLVVAVESAVRRAREHDELARHQDLLRRMLGLATVIARLGSPEEVAALALEGFVGALADSGPLGAPGGASGAFAVQLGAGAPVRYLGYGRYSAARTELDLPEDVASGLFNVFGRAGATARSPEGGRLFLGIHGAGEVRGALLAEGVEVAEAFDDLVAIFGGLLSQALGNAVLYQRSSVDGLTGLYTRTFGLRRLEEWLAMGARHPSSTAVLVLDIDHFKAVNDSYGHAAGDVVLVALGDLMRTACRTTDVPARLGGEEFLLVLPRTDEAAAALVAERVRRLVAAWHGRYEDIDLTATISIGVAAAEPGETDAAALVARADDALYAAKRAGRNRVVRAG